ncbi:MAG: glycosyltransferase family 2 protein [[Pasteurella] aerogenes]|nr:glycosyltransferase family 2 protein [[Pasteurella] aerogenes]
MIKLSIIIPFYNTFSQSKCVLERIEHNLNSYGDIEFILVDDGSTDSTYEKLLNYFKEYQENPNLILLTQKNKGPGGARNNGLSNAHGEYVWFVDSDDDFFVDAIYEDLVNDHGDIDFIDYNYFKNNVINNSMELEEGVYDSQSVDLYMCLGRLWTKLFKREFILQNNIQYPEYCIYEDNYLVYVLPKYIKKFKKSNRVSYVYSQDNDSITRNRKLPPKYFDRVITSYNGIYNSTCDLRYSLFLRFNEMFLTNTLFFILRKLSFNEFKTIYYLISTYNFIVMDLNVKYKPLSWKSRIIELVRFFFPSRNYINYFLIRNKKLWKR